jgi:pimeloyl-ACP methyl ester carboxylesterase
MAADIHQLLVGIGRDHDIRLVGHDIGTMVAYAAANPRDVSKLVLSARRRSRTRGSISSPR